MKNEIDLDNLTDERIIPSLEEELINQPKTNADTKYKIEYADVASRLISAGFTQEHLGYTFQVNVRTIRRWMKAHPEFQAAIDEGKINQQKRLVAKSLQSAAGYDYETSKCKTVRNAAGEIIKKEEIVFHNHQPPNHNLLIWLLCNISRQLGDDNWMSKHTLEVDQKKVVLHLDGKEEFDRITDFAGKYLDNRKVIESTEVNETVQDTNA